MKSNASFFIFIIVILLSGCTGQHLINNKEYRYKVDSAFHQAERLAQNRKDELFSVFNKDLTISGKEAMEFLFAFMPLNDLADYSGSFFLSNVDMSLLAREETPWGKTIPEDVFLHYVLPVRVNNENLDSFRIVYYDEIMARVKTKSIIDAALEINHWCHEKVTYQPSDSRTSAPMSTILSARGRCGEESTFTVAALRTACIPARQVYTPRWAHSDDNHAWVEFWADGDWYYMGACEPEPVPDRGWFTDPARRAMLVNTKSFGAFSGSENILNKYEKYTEINNLEKYALTKRIFVRTVDLSGKSVFGATVEYQLYNYAEFYPIATVPADGNGISSFETGLGDLLIWARKNDEFAFKKITVAGTDTLCLVLENKPPDNLSIDLDLSVPVKRAPAAGPESALIEANDIEIKHENQVRQEYTDSWITRKDAVKFAERINLDTSGVADIISRSMGNYRSIVSLLNNTPDSLRNITISLLKTIADKDLRDTRAEVLSDHILNIGQAGGHWEEDPLFIPYVLNPRVSSEILTPWRGYFKKILPAELTKDAVNNPDILTGLLDKTIRIADTENYSKTPITPSGVWKLKVSDCKSRAICFVAICRTLGIPSRLEPGSNVPQYYFNNSWHDVYFSDQRKPAPEKGYIKFVTGDKNPVPEYYIHFTLSRFENGRYNTLEYNENTKVNDFKEELLLTPGYYMVVTGNRLNDSRILVNLSFFKLSEGEHRAVDIKLRYDKSAPEIFGNADLGKIIYDITKDKEKSDGIAGKGAVLIWIEPDREPTKHVLNDLPLLKQELDSWPGSFVFLNISSGDAGSLMSSELKAKLPANSIFSDDNNLEVLKTVIGNSSPPDISFPLVLMVDGKGEIIFRSEGYQIGIGEQLLKQITNNQ